MSRRAPVHGTDFGLVEWFRPGDYARTEQVLAELSAGGGSYLRTHVSWAEYLAPGGEDWYDWLIPKLADRFELLPCLHYTPPSLSRTGATSGAPRNLKAFADFVDHVLTRFGRHFEHVELWNEPNNLLDWDWRADPHYDLFCEMVGNAAHWTRQRGWKAVLGGPSPFDPVWLELMGERGLLAEVAVVGLHGFPGTWDSEDGSWSGWRRHLGEMRDIVARYNKDAEIWITETGYSTWRNDEFEQARRFIEAIDAPAERVYWYGWRDLPADVAIQEGLWFDPRHYHLGITDAQGHPKLLARLLAEGGVERVRQLTRIETPSIRRRTGRPVAVVGGSGFVGSNLAMSYLEDGRDVIVVDNLSRPGVDRNLRWLREAGGSRLHAAIADIRDEHLIRSVLADCDAVLHMAAQTAVTTSLDRPTDDFEINGRGTLNILEAVRSLGRRVPVVFASTNKVYGNLNDLGMLETEDRYVPEDEELRATGIDEARPLDFCTPYGCSKGLADQYVLDYAKSYELPTAVLRMSCIFGPRQFGTEDQGWLAHFLLRALGGEELTIFGDGRQVRDLLYVDDAVAAYRRVLEQIETVRGQAFNLGGGIGNAVSLRVVIAEIERLLGRRMRLRHEDWRAGDQLYFVADTRKLEKATGWRCRTRWRDGLRHLADWLRSDTGTVKSAPPKHHGIGQDAGRG